MKKTLSILLTLLMVFSLTLVSCSDELLQKAGETLNKFAGMEKKYSEAEKKEQTETVTKQADAISAFLSCTNMVITTATDTSALDDLITAIIDNPACDKDAMTTVSVEAVNDMFVANNPIYSLMFPEVLKNAFKSSAFQLAQAVAGVSNPTDIDGMSNEQIQAIYDGIETLIASVKTAKDSIQNAIKDQEEPNKTNILKGYLGNASIFPITSVVASMNSTPISDPTVVAGLNSDQAYGLFAGFDTLLTSLKQGKQDLDDGVYGYIETALSSNPEDTLNQVLAGFEDATANIPDTLAPVLDVVKNVVELFAANEVVDSTEGTATIGEVATAVTTAKMGSAITQIIGAVQGGADADFLMNEGMDIINAYEDAAKSYMELTGEENMSLLDAIDINALLGAF